MFVAEITFPNSEHLNKCRMTLHPSSSDLAAKIHLLHRCSAPDRKRQATGYSSGIIANTDITYDRIVKRLFFRLCPHDARLHFSSTTRKSLKMVIEKEVSA